MFCKNIIFDKSAGTWNKKLNDFAHLQEYEENISLMIVAHVKRPLSLCQCGDSCSSYGRTQHGDFYEAIFPASNPKSNRWVLPPAPQNTLATHLCLTCVETEAQCWHVGFSPCPLPTHTNAATILHTHHSWVVFMGEDHQTSCAQKISCHFCISGYLLSEGWHHWWRSKDTVGDFGLKRVPATWLDGLRGVPSPFWLYEGWRDVCSWCGLKESVKNYLIMTIIWSTFVNVLKKKNRGDATISYMHVLQLKAFKDKKWAYLKD